jgi:hypothetical protein
MMGLDRKQEAETRVLEALRLLVVHLGSEQAARAVLVATMVLLLNILMD